MVRSSNYITLRYLLFIVVLFTITSLQVSHCTITDHEETLVVMCPEIERQALVSFKQSLKDPYNQFSSWNDEVNCCLWKGVGCNNLTGHVHELHLRNENFTTHGLQGKISSSLLNLKYLDYLDLSQNDFQETIPSFIGSFLNMEYLNLSHAGFLGAIPRTIGNLSNLRALDLQTELFTGTYSDNLDWLSGLSKLGLLNMNSVDLSKASNWLRAIKTLPSLAELHLRACKLDWLTPIDSVNFSSLLTLDLSQNYFDSLLFPKWTLQLTGLTFLDLSENFIEGSIPSFSNTTRLEFIDLSWNRLNSTIPEWLYTCNNLEFVYLEGNHLVGTISNDISNLSSLTILQLNENNFYGSVPPGVWRSCKMHTLDLSHNQLQGAIMPDFFGNMSDCFMRSLEVLYLYWNRISGHISNRFGNLKNLRVLDLSGNSISGAIPLVLGELSRLEFLNLRSNQFVGNLPDTFGNLSNLRSCDVANNSLEGVVMESHLIGLKNLDTFDASRNQLTFNVSPNWIPPFQLSILKLHSTNISGPFPPWLEAQKNIEYLDLSNSGIHGIIPSWVWNISYVDLSSNNLYGNIPNINVGNRSFSRAIYLSSNLFSGSLPQISRNVVFLDLSDNSIIGDVSSVICDNNTAGSYQLSVLNLNGNQLTGELPDCWVRLKHLNVLNVGDNDMYGRIPASIRLLESVQILNLRNNRFSGRIPPSVFLSGELVSIDLSGNYFYGNLPNWRELNSTYVRFIILRSNQLSGEIDSSICSFSSIQILDISNNNLYGSIPSCFHNFTAMVQNTNIASYSQSYEIFTVSVIIISKGQERSYDVLLPLVTSIDLSSNNLSQNIPLEFTRLVSLRMLNLSRNHLTGLIPRDIGDMKRLEFLDLSFNSLTGQIPSSFTMMSSLSSLNVSFNNLTGRIPESTQLQSMNASSFVGNNLCGPPLTTSKCGGKDGDDDGDGVVSHEEADADWFVVLLSLGFTIGLSSFLVVIIFRKSLREAYFGMLDDILERLMSSSLACK